MSLPAWPAAHGAPVLAAKVKAHPEDFVVKEWLGFEPDGQGDHVLLIVRKRDANTLWVAKQLAKFAGCDSRDVGFAGLKDRHAVTEQAFTVPSKHLEPAQWVEHRGEGFEVTAASRQRRKLRRGAHKGNAFTLRLRDLDGDEQVWQQRLTVIASQGVPNYFGPQRFGHQGGNLRRAFEWLVDGKYIEDRHQRGFALSAARAFVFNEVLAERVRSGTWNQLMAGDCANLNGSNSVFSVSSVDQILQQRCLEFDIHPTGPLWGKGPSLGEGAVSELEHKIGQRHSALVVALEAQSLMQERRALRVWVRDLHWRREEGDLVLSFRLQRGGFATTVLAELLGMHAVALGEGED